MAVFVPVETLLQTPPAIAGSPEAHLFAVDGRPHVLIPDGTRIYEIDGETGRALQQAIESGRVAEALEAAGLGSNRPFVSDAAPSAPPVRSLSLAVAQKCNLGCVYCYAQEGDFGAAPRDMPLHVALRAVDLLFSDVGPREPVTLAFLGGEPLTNRFVLRRATEEAARRAAVAGVPIRFSITTNGTLLTEEDARFFAAHEFSVTVSLDGAGEVHDRQRPFKGGRGSYTRILERVAPLLALQSRMQVSARVTVTPGNLDLLATLREFLRLGFSSVGFSPMLTSPAGRAEMTASALERMLDQMIQCGRECEEHIATGRRYPFSNLVTALEQLHRGTHRPYPCGAGASYFGVSAEGELSACHRFVNDASGAMGSLDAGLDRAAQKRWLDQRHVHRQQPCHECWARYLCGGGCHHEVIHRGRPACRYIRGWLDYCLQAYIRLLQARPEYFEAQ